MDTITLLLFIAVIVALGMQTWFLLRKRKGEELPKNDAGMAMLQQQLNQVSQTLDNKLTESNRAMQQQFGQSFKVIADVTQKLTELDNTNKQVVGFAGQLQSLENILKNPKQNCQRALGSRRHPAPSKAFLLLGGFSPASWSPRPVFPSGLSMQVWGDLQSNPG